MTLIPTFPELPITDLSTTDDRYEIVIYETPDHRFLTINEPSDFASSSSIFAPDDLFPTLQSALDYFSDIDHRNTDPLPELDIDDFPDFTPIHTLIIDNPFDFL